MKKWTFLFGLIFFFNSLVGQLDLKGGLHASYPPGFLVAAEYAVLPDVGVEIGLSSTYDFSTQENSNVQLTGSSLIVTGRLYFNPRFRIDRTFIGVYFRPFHGVQYTRFTPMGIRQVERVSGMGVGLLAGKKFVKKRKYFIEINFGFGRNFNTTVNDGFIPVFRFGSGDSFQFDAMWNVLICRKLGK